MLRLQADIDKVKQSTKELDEMQDKHISQVAETLVEEKQERLEAEAAIRKEVER